MYVLKLVKKIWCIGVEISISRDREYELYWEWSDDAVGRGLLRNEEKGFHSLSFMHAIATFTAQGRGCSYTFYDGRF